MINEESFIRDFQARVSGILTRLREELRGVRTNRPSVDLVEEIKVNYYDQWFTIKQLGSISVVPPRELRITVWDKNAMGPIMKAIEDAKAGLNVSSDGTVVRAVLSTLNMERREELVKIVKKTTEASRIELRSGRDEAMKKLKGAESAGEISEDRVFKLKDKIQHSVDTANKEIESGLAEKIKEIEA